MITILQVITSIILIALILVQERSSGLSNVFGGGGGGPAQTRRGAEKKIYQATIFAAVAFFTLAVLNLIF